GHQLDPKAIYGYAVSPRRISSDCWRSVGLSGWGLDRQLLILLTERPAVSTACRLPRHVDRVFVVRSGVDVDLPGGKIKRCDVVWPSQSDSFGAAISVEPQQLWKTRSIKESGNPEGLGVGGRDDRLASC